MEYVGWIYPCSSLSYCNVLRKFYEPQCIPLPTSVTSSLQLSILTNLHVCLSIFNICTSTHTYICTDASFDICIFHQTDIVSTISEMLAMCMCHNCIQVPINKCPFQVQTYQRDGGMVTNANGGSAPNYYPNSFSELPQPDPTQPDVTPYQ